MIARTQGCALRGLTGVPIAVEAYAANGLPHFTVVGLTDRAIQEARERVRAAIGNSGFKFPQKRLTVNLAPAELPKEGTGLDLPMALAVLGVSDHPMDTEGVAAIGELGLDGALRPVTGALAMARSLQRAGVEDLIIPVANGPETALVEGLRVLPAPNLSACVAHLEGARLLQPLPHQPVAQEPWDADALARIRGQVVAKRALEIAAAGGHNLLLMGPPGVGKTMLAHALAGLLPPLDNEAALEVAALYSLKGALGDRSPMSTRPPFRAPHHSVSRAGLIGGGSGLAQPGEISLAHASVRECPSTSARVLRINGSVAWTAADASWVFIRHYRVRRAISRRASGSISIVLAACEHNLASLATPNERHPESVGRLRRPRAGEFPRQLVDREARGLLVFVKERERLDNSLAIRGAASHQVLKEFGREIERSKAGGHEAESLRSPGQAHGQILGKLLRLTSLDLGTSAPHGSEVFGRVRPRVLAGNDDRRA